jgi:hypothetical protein
MMNAPRESPFWPKTSQEPGGHWLDSSERTVVVSEKDLKKAYVQRLDGNAPLMGILKDETRVRRPVLHVHVPERDQPVPKAVGFPGPAGSVR